MKVQCRTLFDITATGITGHHKSSKIPFVDRAGQHITDELSWNRGRNQQRNWETLTQLIQLRTQLSELQDPVCKDGVWQFDFATEVEQVFGHGPDPLGSLKADCEAVPMLIGLGEQRELEPCLVTDQNLWFDIVR